MGTISFLGEHVITGDVLEKLLNAGGSEVWFDLLPSRYLSYSSNSLVGGALKVQGWLKDANDEVVKETPLDKLRAGPDQADCGGYLPISAEDKDQQNGVDDEQN